MRRFLLFTLTVGAALAAVPLHAGAQATATARRDSVIAFVRNYVDASNRADIQASMDMMSKSPGVSSASIGTITRGWESLRAQADSMAGSEGLMKISLGTMDVTMLGSNATLVVTSAAIRVETEQGPVQLRGAITLVLERVGGAWKVLHEHLSIPLPEG